MKVFIIERIKMDGWMERAVSVIARQLGLVYSHVEH